MGPDRIPQVVVLHLLLSHIVMLCNPLHRHAKLQLKTRQPFAPRIPAGKPLQNFIPPAVINSVISCLNIVRNSLEAFAQWPALSSSLNNSYPFLGDMLEKVVTESGHVPMQPPKLQGAAGVHQGTGPRAELTQGDVPSGLGRVLSTAEVSAGPRPLAPLSPGPSGNILAHAASVCICLFLATRCLWLRAISCLSDLSLLFCG